MTTTTITRTPIARFIFMFAQSIHTLHRHTHTHTHLLCFQCYEIGLVFFRYWFTVDSSSLDVVVLLFFRSVSFFLLPFCVLRQWGFRTLQKTNVWLTTSRFLRVGPVALCICFVAYVLRLLPFNFIDENIKITTNCCLFCFHQSNETKKKN